MDTKKCSKCKVEYPATTEYFKRFKGGLFSSCKQCETLERQTTEAKAKKREYDREYRLRPEAIAKRQRPEVKQKRREYSRDYYQRPEIKEKLQQPEAKKIKSEYDLERRRQPRIKAQRLEYKRGPKARVVRLRRKARKRGLPNEFTVLDEQRMYNYWENKCVLCRREAQDGLILTADHWIALSDPRPDNPGTVVGNMIPLCYSTKAGLYGCNNRKLGHDPVEWLISVCGKPEAEEILESVNIYFEWAKSARQSG